MFSTSFPGAAAAIPSGTTLRKLTYRMKSCPPLAWCKELPDLGPTHPSIMLPWILCYKRLILIFNMYQNYLICFTLTTLALNQNHSPESELQLVVLRNRHFKVDPQLILMQVDLGLHREKHCILNSTPTLSMWFYSSTFPWPKMHLLLLISGPTNKFLKIQLNSSIQSLVKPASVSLLSVFLSMWFISASFSFN